MLWDAEMLERDSRFTWIGRRLENSDPLRLFWIGSGIVLRAKLRELTARIEADWSEQSPWMSVMIDGEPVARFPLRRGLHTYALLTGMDPGVAHRVSLTRDVQPMENDERLLVRLHSLELDGELLEQATGRRIEFVGDSLTSGEGLAGPESAAEWKTVWMSGTRTYAAQVCAMLDAEGEWISQSGWGIVTDWIQERSHTLPAIYDQVCALHEAGREAYDFASHPVDAVVINLGTNDLNALNSLAPEKRPQREQEIVTTVHSFLEHVRKVRPGVPILWVCGMCGDGLNALLERAVTEAARAMADDSVAFIALPACGPEEQGSLGHPGWLSHRRCAELIAAWLKERIEKPAAL